MGGEEERQEEVEGIKNDDSTLRRVKNPPDNFHDCDIKKKAEWVHQNSIFVASAYSRNRSKY